LRFDDGSLIDLPALLEAQAGKLLGPAFTARYGSAFPLLPKTLNIKELLSVQGHPPGHTEVYIIIDAEPGATLRLGFNRDIDPVVFTRELLGGMQHQDRLLELLGSETDAQAVHRIVAPWLAQRDTDADVIIGSLQACATPASPDLTEAVSVLKELKALYWQVLDSMNAIAVEPGQIIHNATPQRLLAAGLAEASAEVHALGNPDRREILALEIRRPGPTFRAWDNVRFPKREVDVTAAVEALNLRATSPEEFVVERRPVPGREGVFVSVDSDYFCVEHLMPDRTLAVNVPASPPHSLHCLAGAVDISDTSGRLIGHLERGESALVPVGVGAYVVESTEAAEVVRVTLPER
jgi:mannose-6-phosphate isomerase class I